MGSVESLMTLLARLIPSMYTVCVCFLAHRDAVGRGASTPSLTLIATIMELWEKLVPSDPTVLSDTQATTMSVHQRELFPGALLPFFGMSSRDPFSSAERLFELLG